MRLYLFAPSDFRYRNVLHSHCFLPPLKSASFPTTVFPFVLHSIQSNGFIGQYLAIAPSLSSLSL